MYFLPRRVKKLKAAVEQTHCVRSLVIHYSDSPNSTLTFLVTFLQTITGGHIKTGPTVQTKKLHVSLFFVTNIWSYLLGSPRNNVSVSVWRRFHQNKNNISLHRLVKLGRQNKMCFRGWKERPPPLDTVILE